MDNNKVIFILKGIYDKTPDKNPLLEIVNFSTFDFKEYTEHFVNKRWQAYKVTVHTEHEIFIKNYHLLQPLKETLQADLNSIITMPVEEVNIVPDYDKLETVNSEIRPVYTPWQEINKAQTELIAQLQKTSSLFEIKNIGNTSRVILNNLAQQVFKKEKHTPSDKSIDISGDRYKNQLHSYISIELAEKNQAELRGFADAAINLVDKAIILANAVTHRSKSEKQIAEICVTGIINVISIITFIENK